MTENDRYDNPTPEEFLEREAGSRYHRAIILADLQSAVEHAFEEFRYDDEPPIPPDAWNALQVLNEADIRA